MRRSWLLAAGVVATLCCCIEFAVGQNVEAEQPPKALVETPPGTFHDDPCPKSDMGGRILVPENQTALNRLYFMRVLFYFAWCAFPILWVAWHHHRRYL